MNEVLSDVTISAHKSILSSCSHVFETTFLSQFKESNDKEIEIKDTNIEVFEVFLKCIYLEEFNSKSINDYSLAIDVFKIRHKYQIKDIV
jgi:hypothetical protein